jgi:hypothetical protein
MADHQAGELRSFEHFSQMMSNLPYLKAIDKKRRNLLLRKLYQAAVDKSIMEGLGKAFRDGLPAVRAARRRTVKAVGLLGKALRAVGEARASCKVDLAACETKSKTAGESFTFAAMEKNLNLSVAFLKEQASTYAAYVHPKLRTDAEKQLAKEYMAAFGDFPAPNLHNLPSGEKARPLDAWFIRRAAECIDRYKSKNRTIEGYDIIIAKLFEAAFKEFRSPASVQKARKGRRERELQYSPPVKILFVSPPWSSTNK